MDNFLAGLSVLLVLFVAASIALGVNLKDWFGWFQVACSFFMGMLLMGENLAERLIIGFISAAVTMWVGSIVWKRHNF